MNGIFSVLNFPAVILFDSGASHSFISAKFSAKCQLPFHHTNGDITISTPGGRVATYQINKHVPIRLGSFIFKTTLLIMGLESVDIILGTDWLSRHHAVIDVAARAIEIHSPMDGEIPLYLRVATYQINKHVPIRLGSFIFKTTLLIMGLESVDIILGTDWLSRHHAVIDVAARAIEIHSPMDGEIPLYLPD
jgi:aryl carrier-like protein